MSNLDLAIAAQSAKLEYRKLRIQQRKVALRNGALNFCRKPTTLVGALVTGAVLAVLYPPGRIVRTNRPKSEGIGAFLRDTFSASLKLMMVNAIGRLFTPAQPNIDVERGDLP